MRPTITPHRRRKTLVRNAFCLRKPLHQHLYPTRNKGNAQLKPLKHRRSLITPLSRPTTIHQPSLQHLRQPRTRPNRHSQKSSQTRIQQMLTSPSLLQSHHQRRDRGRMVPVNGRRGPHHITRGRTVTGAGVLHASPRGLGLITTVVHNGGISGTLTSLAFSGHHVTNSIGGYLRSTVTGTRGGRGLSISDLIITRT